MLDDKQKKKLETHTVELLLVLRSAYLREQDGRPPMNYYEQLQNRMRGAARQTASASEWASLMQRRLQIGSLRKDDSRALVELIRFCDENNAHGHFLDAIDRDHALLIALVQLTVDEQKEAARLEAEAESPAPVPVPVPVPVEIVAAEPATKKRKPKSSLLDETTEGK